MKHNDANPDTNTPLYRAGTIKRQRASHAEMADRDAFLINYAHAHGPITVRGLYYQAEVHAVAGIDKTESGYRKVQAQVLKLRREGRLNYEAIADSSRFMRKPQTFNGWEDALRDTARFYRKDLWADTDLEVEIWLEKNALAGVLFPVTSEYDVPLMCTGGFSSETFAHEAVARLRGSGRTLIVHALYDFDRSGGDASRSLCEKVERFGHDYGVPVQFRSLGLSFDQVTQFKLPTRPAKDGTKADRRWPHAFAAELDALPPDELRRIVRDAIEDHLPQVQLAYLKNIEALERATLLDFVGGLA
ncbi:hypothetical protein [Cypionkella psychrotolerans]|uniref:hypothetical protein n=1 Tax=Cypionkella psychrotolerans TaxID=1678131 RepID=UPI000ACA159E|nr:hypothetical protein [Cypionkella psychrotolerans]